LEHLADGTANGFVFNDFTEQALGRAVARAMALYRRADEWRSVRQRAMQQHLGWGKAAAEYLALYQHLCT
jgi:starch synthase